jgi:hypothetical protein
MASVREGAVRLSGRVGSIVYLSRDGQAFAAAAPSFRPRSTALQGDAQRRLAIAGRAWGELSLAEIEAWRRYAATLSRPNAAGVRKAPRADNVFRGLAAKYLQVHGTGPVPNLPPESAFLGDGVVVSAEAEIGGVRFHASGPNADGVLTELLLQPLRARHYTPQPRDYRTQAFVDFEEGALEALVPAHPGAYACAFRFVRSATGQESPLVPCGVVVVEG